MRGWRGAKLEASIHVAISWSWLTNTKRDIPKAWRLLQGSLLLLSALPLRSTVQGALPRAEAAGGLVECVGRAVPQAWLGWDQA